MALITIPLPPRALAVTFLDHSEARFGLQRRCFPKLVGTSLDPGHEPSCHALCDLQMLRNKELNNFAIYAA